MPLASCATWLTFPSTVWKPSNRDCQSGAEGHYEPMCHVKPGYMTKETVAAYHYLCLNGRFPGGPGLPGSPWFSSCIFPKESFCG